MGDPALAIIGASVYDGTGAEPRDADVLVADGLIKRVSPPGSLRGVDVPQVDAAGLSVCPGFIDVHSHADNAPALAEPDTAKILQGVTTEVVGNCGFSLAPSHPDHLDDLDEFVSGFFPSRTPRSTRLGTILDDFSDRGYVTNHAPLVGHGALRSGVIGWEDRAATEPEVARMVALLADALRDGAFGLSSGLIYAPGIYGDHTELAALAASLPASVPYATHMRGEGSHLEASLDEALAIARAGVAVHISHLKVVGHRRWGSMGGVLERLDQARADGCDVRHDVYPYTAGSTILAALLPPWALAGGREATLTRLRDPEIRRDVERALASEGDGWENLAVEAGWPNVVIASSRSGNSDGSSVTDIARQRGTTQAHAMVDLLLEEEMEVSMIAHFMATDDLRAALVHPATMIGSDGLPPGVAGRPHPRGFSTFPRVLGRLSIREGWIRPAEAIRKMTSAAADAFGLTGRGLIRAGYAADLVAFDETTLIDRGTFEEPTTPPSGIAWVMLAGQVVVTNGVFSGARRGRPLAPRHSGNPVQTTRRSAR